VLCEKCFGEAPPFYQVQEHIKEFQSQCTEAIKACEADIKKSEQYGTSFYADFVMKLKPGLF
jgi:hypothetical protein